jgi:hypothetical protein
MRFMIFVPNAPSTGGTAEDLLKSVGLEHLARGIDPKASEGPDGLRGTLFWWSNSTVAGHFLYKPEVQTWIPSAKCGDRASGAYWIGFFNDSPPTEEELRRPDHRKGSFTKLGNGERWSIVTRSKLDQSIVLNSDGSMSFLLDESLNWFVTSINKRRADAFETMNADGKSFIIFDFEKDWMFLVSVLQINYRITPEVVSHLRLFSLSSIRNLISCLMEMPLEEEANV